MINKKYFIKRGLSTVGIVFQGDTYDITVKRPTNYENDSIIEKYTETGPNGEIEIKAADLMQEMLVRFIVELPFEVPADNEFTEFKKWSELTHEEKVRAVQVMDSDLRDEIFKAIESKTHLSVKDIDKFKKRLSRIEKVIKEEKFPIFVVHSASPRIVKYAEENGFSVFFSYEFY